MQPFHDRPIALNRLSLSFREEHENSEQPHSELWRQKQEGIEGKGNAS